jgi:uncharacterized membrane protein
MKTNTAMLAGIGLGAGAAYLFDPALGRRRRAGVRDAVTRAAHKSGDAFGATSRDLANRSRGLAARTTRYLQADAATDDVLVERVRARLGRHASHPHAIRVEAHERVVTLRGPILSHEADRLLSAMRRVRGARDVRDALERHDEPGNVPALQGGAAREGERWALSQESWSPATRALVGMAGVILASVGVRRGHLAGAALSAAGTALIARALTDTDVRRLVGVSGGRRAVDLEKTITIEAPVGDVFAFWQHYENFPKFMSHVRDVRPGEVDGRSYWVVDGPAGVPISFEAETTRVVPNELMAWKSVEGSSVAHAGTVRFEPVGDRATRVNVRFSYNPPAGAIGHAAAWLLGADAKQLMDDDLARMKTLLETGRAPRDAAQ